jgi:hypothetical protein
MMPYNGFPVNAVAVTPSPFLPFPAALSGCSVRYTPGARSVTSSCTRATSKHKRHGVGWSPTGDGVLAAPLALPELHSTKRPKRNVSSSRTAPSQPMMPLQHHFSVARVASA